MAEQLEGPQAADEPTRAGTTVDGHGTDAGEGSGDERADEPDDRLVAGDTGTVRDDTEDTRGSRHDGDAGHRPPDTGYDAQTAARSRDDVVTAPAEQDAVSEFEAARDPTEQELQVFAELGEARYAELKATGELQGHKPQDGETAPAGRGQRWRTVADEVGEVRSYTSFDAARNDLGVRAGKELHHIVEQAQAKPVRSGFPVERINSTDNLVHLPADVHTEVSRHYSRRPRGFDRTVRDTLNGKPWNDQHRYGQKAIDSAWDRVERHRAEAETGPEPSWRTVADEQGDVHSYPSFEAARKDLGIRPGTELHHIVEQAQARPERSGFPVIRINSTDNLVQLPADVHTEVSRHYSTRPRGFDRTVRDTLNGKPWDDQHRYGRKAIDEAWRRVRSEHD